MHTKMQQQRSELKCFQYCIVVRLVTRVNREIVIVMVLTFCSQTESHAQALPAETSTEIPKSSSNLKEETFVH